eukprot:gene5744-11613_t
MTAHCFFSPTAKLTSLFNLKNSLYSNEIDAEFDLEHQIFCNRELNGEQLQAVGFDMDFTLAQYNEAFDLLAFNGAKAKLHYNLGYPKEVLDFTYEPLKCRRGLIIDKSKGNIIKVDRHKYVRKVYHGETELSVEERKACYLTAFSQMPTFTEANFVNIDTLFLLIDALLFRQLVHLRDQNPDLLNNKGYEQLYKDIRQSVDLCHRDGVIKDAVSQDPCKEAGKKVFLLTNSMWTYTDAVMTYLTTNSGNTGSNDNTMSKSKSKSAVTTAMEGEWTALFDLVIVGAAKPSFLTSDYLTLFSVMKDGSLRNIEDKDSFKLSTAKKTASTNSNYNVIQGGYWQDLHRILEISSGENILSKRTLGWRTCLIIPELEHELQAAK